MVMEDGDQFRIQVMETGEGRVLRVEGPLTLSTAGRLRDALLEAWQAGKKTIFDAAGITDIDLAGLQLLCSAHRTYQRTGTGFELAAVSPQVVETARAAGFDNRTSACASRDGNCIWKR